ncbi:MAG: ABC transporter ATP-binding protein [Oscillospiraceae bacterium]|nr:ABC transporter ATP-binding protein [Oscillospiraceae bacterium]
MKNNEAVIRFEHVSMQFPGVLANDDVSLEIRRGEVFALIGENGAGKSTLMNILYGIQTPSSGEVWIKGKRVEQYDPRIVIEQGVGMVHQHFMLVPSFTVAQNIVLSREPRKHKIFFDNAAAEAAARKLEAEYGLTVPETEAVEDISVGLQQRVEILKALYRGAEILILDEPTAVLTPQETEELFSVIRRVVRDKGMTVIIITHKLDEVMAISDRVGVMRKGRLVGIHETKDVDAAKLASLMVGRPVIFDELIRSGEPGATALRVEHLQVSDHRGLPAVRDLSLELRAGEILGIAAIEGNGQSELIEAITGMIPVRSGRVTVLGREVTGLEPGEIRAAGLAHVPEDRLATGISGLATVADNLLIGRQREPRFNRFGIQQNRKAIRDYAQEVYQRYDIRGAGVDSLAGDMSGGNMQKVVIAREFSFDTPVLVISQPTRGVDVGAIEFIHSRIMEKRNQGAAILLSSADLDEVFRLSDRIITLFEGEITGTFRAGEISKEDVGLYMTGSKRQGGQEA